MKVLRMIKIMEYLEWRMYGTNDFNELDSGQ